MRVHNPKHVMVMAMGLALGLAGCASTGGSARPAGASSTRIVRAELESVGQIDALQAVERLRPRWTSTRVGPGSADPVIYIDGTRRSGLGDLRALRASDVEQMEYMSANDATTRFGTGHTGGAIMVTMRR